MPDEAFVEPAPAAGNRPDQQVPRDGGASKRPREEEAVNGDKEKEEEEEEDASTPISRRKTIPLQPGVVQKMQDEIRETEISHPNSAYGVPLPSAPPIFAPYMYMPPPAPRDGPPRSSTRPTPPTPSPTSGSEPPSKKIKQADAGASPPSKKEDKEMNKENIEKKK